MGKQGDVQRQALVLALSVCLGCAGGAAQGAGARAGDPPAAPLYAGDADGPPSMEGLPECDVPVESLSEDMRRAWRLVGESLAVPPPAEPVARSSEALSEWSETTLRAWMERKSEIAMAAREALNEAAVRSSRERIVAGALLGVTFEDVADVLVNLPMPEELNSEPEVAAIYGEVLISQAKPFLVNAANAYEACAGNAEGHGLLPHWGRFCARRRQGLPGTQDPAPPAADNTEVTVTRE